MKMEGVRRGPPNTVRHHGEEKEEEVEESSRVLILRYYSSIGREGLRKTIRNLSLQS
jgi:hypothetical protein